MTRPYFSSSYELESNHGVGKTKLLELYLLSLIEPADVIEALDPEQADIIKKVNMYLDLKNELSEKGISSKVIGQMRKIQAGFENCEDIPRAIALVNANVCNSRN